MKCNQLSDSCFYFQGSVNIGYVKNETGGLLIDSGLDDAAAKKVMKVIKENEWPLTDLFITHAHADHYGGAHFLQKHYEIHTYAPHFEEAIMTYPKLEPLYLFQGNEPPQEMRNKFLEGKPIQIDTKVKPGKQKLGAFHVELHSVPGHSYNMMALEIDSILYATDAYFDEASLQKHNIPFIVQYEETVRSLRYLLTLKVKGAVPGHGIYEPTFTETVKNNIEYHQNVKEDLFQWIIKQKEPIPFETLISSFCSKRDINIQNFTSWALFRTGVTAYVQALVSEQKVEYVFQNNTLKVSRR
ncbi:MBL fold metallo-hydrolase [Alkalihalobacterium bogoriense]|uniref:MBL fold metallo-hydrolase n=1 Tax=Alkalihalobacterium bogoriense TaxID=246272 RepID=UPI00047CA765|nr:MBL fold metallo-hydrolase [Alkalihalobacterium bogoriense]